MIDLRQLRAFVAIADEGHITHARRGSACGSRH